MTRLHSCISCTLRLQGCCTHISLCHNFAQKKDVCIALLPLLLGSMSLTHHPPFLFFILYFQLTEHMLYQIWQTRSWVLELRSRPVYLFCSLFLTSSVSFYSLHLFWLNTRNRPVFYKYKCKSAHQHPGADMELHLLVFILQPPLGRGCTPTEVLSFALV